MRATDARAVGDGWDFRLPESGIEPLLERLIAAGHGIAGLSIERGSLHDAFVKIVGKDALMAASQAEIAA